MFCDRHGIDTPESRELSRRFSISLATATRWLRRGKERSIARFLARREAEYGVIKNATHGWDGEEHFKSANTLW